MLVKDWKIKMLPIKWNSQLNPLGICQDARNQCYKDNNKSGLAAIENVIDHLIGIGRNSDNEYFNKRHKKYMAIWKIKNNQVK